MSVDILFDILRLNLILKCRSSEHWHGQCHDDNERLIMEWDVGFLPDKSKSSSSSRLSVTSNTSVTPFMMSDNEKLIKTHEYHQDPSIPASNSFENEKNNTRSSQELNQIKQSEINVQTNKKPTLLQLANEFNAMQNARNISND